MPMYKNGTFLHLNVVVLIDQLYLFFDTTKHILKWPLMLRRLLTSVKIFTVLLRLRACAARGVLLLQLKVNVSPACSRGQLIESTSFMLHRSCVSLRLRPCSWIVVANILSVILACYLRQFSTKVCVSKIQLEIFFCLMLETSHGFSVGQKTNVLLSLLLLCNSLVCEATELGTNRRFTLSKKLY